MPQWIDIGVGGVKQAVQLVDVRGGRRARCSRSAGPPAGTAEESVYSVHPPRQPGRMWLLLLLPLVLSAGGRSTAAVAAAAVTRVS